MFNINDWNELTPKSELEWIIQQLPEDSEINDFQNKYLKVTLEVLDLAEMLKKDIWQDVQYSDHNFSLIKKHFEISNKVTLKDIDTLRNECMRKVWVLLKKDVESIGISLYPIEARIEAGVESLKDCRSQQEIWTPEETPQMADKYLNCLEMLSKLWISLDDISVWMEELESRNQRTVPYYLIWVNNERYQKTIAVCDEIWQATFVYQGILKMDSFKWAWKSGMLSKTQWKKINYWDNYDVRVQTAIQTIYPPKVIFDKELNVSLSDQQINELTAYVEQIKEPLWEAGVYECEWIWYFWNAWWIKKYSYLRSFPNVQFNQSKNIWWVDWRLTSVYDLKKVFLELDLKVATDEEEEKRWAWIVIDNKERLEEEASVYLLDNVWYFWDINNGETYLFFHSFPNCTYNKRHGLGDSKWQIWNPQHLSGMFKALWLQVATPDQERKRWADIIVNEHAEDLAENAHIYCINDIWYFGDAKSSANWQNLYFYPNGRYNVKNWIGTNTGALSKASHMQTLFNHLWLKVATPDQEKKRWADKIMNEYAQLLETDSNIPCINDVWYFWNAKGANTWKYLMYYPNGSYNKQNSIWNKVWGIWDINTLIKLFKHFGFKIASIAQEKVRWRETILDMKNDIEENLEIYYNKWIWDFSDCKDASSWRKLSYFPSSNFNKLKGIWNKKWCITNKKALEKMFQALWFKTINRGTIKKD